MANNRDQWGSSLGFILAAAGSAVGLGNLWKFPYIAWDNEGGAFVLVYLVCIALIGMPIMMAEIVLGRYTQKSPVPAFEQLCKKVKGGKLWTIVGWISVLGGSVILSYYAVIAGWSLSSFLKCMDWSINGYQAPADGAFGAFVSNGPVQLGFTAAFSILTALIVIRGISGGIEKATKVLMPVLFAILVLLVVNSFTLDGIGKTLSFLFTPNFSKLDGHSLLEALGHSFFTLSLGMGAMITYGSYMSKKESINKAATAIVVLDTVIAIMACIIMYSIIFSYGIENQLSKSSAGMLFVVLPTMFYNMTGGAILGPVFFILVAFAALSSTISLLEVVVSMFVDKLKMTRIKATIIASSCIFVLSIACALSNGAVDFFSTWQPFGPLETLNDRLFASKQGVLNVLDHLASNWILPIGGLFITLFTGWFLSQDLIAEELNLKGPDGEFHTSFKVYQFLIRFVGPAAILAIIIAIIMGADFS